MDLEFSKIKDDNQSNENFIQKDLECYKHHPDKGNALEEAKLNATERRKIASRRWKHVNKEKCRQHKQIYVIRNRERIRERQRNYQKNNKEVLREQRREYDKKNRQKINKYHRDYNLKKKGQLDDDTKQVDETDLNKNSGSPNDDTKINQKEYDKLLKWQEQKKKQKLYGN